MKAVGVLILGMILCGCASSTKQSDALLEDNKGVASSFLIDGVPFLNQAAGYCGPATLTMAMNWSGKLLTIEEVAPQVFTPGMHGTFQSDMIGAARRHGLMAVPIEGLESLLMEVSSGHPVIVFENLALSWWPKWHYALVFGYDLKREIVIMHSGQEASKQWDIRKFERSWKLGEYWGLVVLPPHQLASTANELTHIVAANGIEMAGRLREAGIAYQTLLRKWPTSLGALVGLANLAYGKKQYLKAVEYLKIATSSHPQVAGLWYNRALAEQAANMKTSALKSAQIAVNLAPAELKSTFENSLRNILL